MLEPIDRYVEESCLGFNPAEYIAAVTARVLRDRYRTDHPLIVFEATMPRSSILDWMFNRGFKEGIASGRVFSSYYSNVNKLDMSSSKPTQTLLARIGVQHVGDECWQRFYARFELEENVPWEVRSALDICVSHWTEVLNPWRETHARRGTDPAYSLFQFEKRTL